METDIEKKYFAMKKAMVSPLESITQIYQSFLDFIDSAQFSPFTLRIAEIEGLFMEQTHDRDSLERILREELKTRISKLYEPTRQHVEKLSLF